MKRCESFLEVCKDRQYKMGFCKKHFDRYLKAKARIQKAYRKNHRKHINKYSRKYVKHKRATVPSFRLKTNLRARLLFAFLNYSVDGKTKNASEYGIDFDAIIRYLLKRKPKDFDRKMYHIDHVVPLCRFDFNKPEQIRMAFLPENHQWLSKKDNIRKGSKLTFKLEE